MIIVTNTYSHDFGSCHEVLKQTSLDSLLDFSVLNLDEHYSIVDAQQRTTPKNPIENLHSWKLTCCHYWRHYGCRTPRWVVRFNNCCNCSYVWTRHWCSWNDVVVDRSLFNCGISSYWRPCCQNIQSRCCDIWLQSWIRAH